MRHRWSAPIRTTFTTDRVCARCGIIRRTRHDDPHAWPWVEWWTMDGVSMARQTPKCEPVDA